jgi:hypothetical protein
MVMRRETRLTVLALRLAFLTLQGDLNRGSNQRDDLPACRSFMRFYPPAQSRASTRSYSRIDAQLTFSLGFCP